MTDLILREEEPIELTDEELDAVTGGLFNINAGNTGVGASQGGIGNLNVAALNVGIGNISVL
jgi:bacteriocin-like protein